MTRRRRHPLRALTRLALRLVPKALLHPLYRVAPRGLARALYREAERRGHAWRWWQWTD